MESRGQKGALSCPTTMSAADLTLREEETKKDFASPYCLLILYYASMRKEGFPIPATAQPVRNHCTSVSHFLLRIVLPNFSFPL